jgi:DNA-binding transcriptional LysR family regulator
VARGGSTDGKGRGRTPRGRGAKGAGTKDARSTPKKSPTRTTASRDAAAATPPPPPVDEASDRVFRLGAVAGATPGKWIGIWRERMPGVPLELEPLEVRDQGERLRSGDLDAALVRLPIDDASLHAIPLYDEVPIVVVSADSALTVAAELTPDDLAGEVLIVPLDDVLGIALAGTVAPVFAPPADTAEAIATVAAGVGVVVVPMSLARLHHRKDVEHRPLQGGPVSTVALAWPADRTTPDVETFIGIVRGRTANSSR